MSQSSKNIKKPKTIVGNEVAVTGILTKNPLNLNHPECVDLSAHICQDVDCVRSVLPEDELVQSCGSVIGQTGEDLRRISGHLDNPPILEVGDAYYMKAPLVEVISELDNCELVARMRKDTVAFEEPKPKVPGTRGPQAKVGEKIKLMDLFESEETEFLNSSIQIYGQKRRIRYTVVDLLWKRDKRFKLRFVLVEILDTSGIRGAKRLILGSTDRSLSAKSIILAYAWRMKIERSFRDLNQHIGFSDYHFWSKAVPELEKREPGTPSPLEKIEDAHDKKLIALCLKRVEMHLLVCLIAQGLTQLVALKLSESGVKESEIIWKRTFCQDFVSPWVAQEFLRQLFFTSQSVRENPKTKSLIEQSLERLESFLFDDVLIA